jgi:hypothetical protein
MPEDQVDPPKQSSFLKISTLGGQIEMQKSGWKGSPDGNSPGNSLCEAILPQA